MVVSDPFLLEVAGIAASLLGFFVVGVFFFVQRGMFPNAAELAQRYMQVATGTIILLYGMTLLVSLALVVVPAFWAALLYLACTLILLFSVWRLGVVISQLHRVLSIQIMSQSLMWLAAIGVAMAPWALGGFQPSRSHITLAIGLTAIFAFVSTASLVLSAFEISRLEATARTAAMPSTPHAGEGIGTPDEQHESVDTATPVATIGTQK